MLRRTGNQAPPLDLSEFARAELQLRENLQHGFESVPPDVLVDTERIWEETGDWLQEQTTKLTEIACRDPRKTNKGLAAIEEHVTSRVDTIFEEVRSERVIDGLRKRALAGELTKADHQLVTQVKHTELAKHAWGRSLVHESVRELSPGEGRGAVVAEQLLSLAETVDPRPPADRQLAREIASVVVQHTRGESISATRVDQLARRASEVQKIRAVTGDSTTIAELVDVLQEHTVNAAMDALNNPARRRALHNVSSLLSGLSPDALHPSQVVAKLEAIKGDTTPDTQPSQTRARVTAAITTFSVAASVVALVEPSAAAAPSPRTSVESLTVSQASQNLATVAATQLSQFAPQPAAMVTPLRTLSIETVNLANLAPAPVAADTLQPSQTVGALDLSTGEPIKTVQASPNLVDLSTPSVAETPVTATGPANFVPVDISRLVTPPAASAPRRPVSMPLPRVRTVNTGAHPAAETITHTTPTPATTEAPTTGTTTAASPADAAHTSLEQPVVAVSADSVNAPQTVLSTETASDPTGAREIYDNLVTSGASLDDRVNQLKAVLAAEGYQPITNDTLTAGIQPQAADLEQKLRAAATNKTLSPDQLNADLKKIDIAMVLFDYPAYLSNAGTANLINKDSGYVGVVAAKVFGNPTTYDPDGQNADFLAAFNGFDAGTMSAADQLFASVKEDSTTPDQQYAELQTLDPATAASFKAALDAEKAAAAADAAKAAAAKAAADLVGKIASTPDPTKPAPPTTDKPTPKPAPQPHANKPAPSHNQGSGSQAGETTTAHLSGTNLSILAIKNFVKANPDAENAGYIMQRVVEKTGLETYQAAGITGNPMQESGGNSVKIKFGSKQTKGGSAKGAFQWEGPRFDGLVQFAHDRGTSWTDPETQVDFMIQEMHKETAGGHLAELQRIIPSATAQTTTIQALGMVHNAADAAVVFELTWERAGTPMMQHRINGANWLDRSVNKQKTKLLEASHRVQQLHKHPKTGQGAKQQTQSHKTESFADKPAAQRIDELAKSFTVDQPFQSLGNMPVHDYTNKPYRDAVEKYGGGANGSTALTDCNWFVETVVRAANADSNYTQTPTGGAEQHDENSSLWNQVANHGTSTVLHAGDIFVSPNHTYIVVSTPNGLRVAQASQHNHGPTLERNQSPYFSDSEGVSFEIFRHV